MKNFLLIDDHEIVRSGVKSVLRELFTPCNVYEANNEQSGIKCLKERSYDLIIMDVQMPDTDSFGLLEYMRIRYPETGVLIFSMSAENIYARRFLKAGAMGFVSKSSGLTELQKAIALALNKQKYVSTELATQLGAEIGGDGQDNPFNKLSPKEFEIYTLLIAGKSVTQISKILDISTSTVGTHKARLFTKLRVTNLLELINLGKAYNIQ